MSDEGNYNFSDSSLELFDTFKPRSKTKSSSKLKLSHNINVDHIDFPEESKRSINSSLSVYNISSSSNESFKSFTSLHSNSSNKINSKDNSSDIKNSFTKIKYKDKNHIQDNLHEFKNNYTTPVKKHNIQSNHLSESAKLLDRIYGKEWRYVDGVLHNPKAKDLNDELYGDYNE